MAFRPLNPNGTPGDPLPPPLPKSSLPEADRSSDISLSEPVPDAPRDQEIPLLPARNTIPSVEPERPTTTPSYNNKMYLKLRRSQRETMIAGNPVFILTARVELSKQDLDLVNKYRLAKEVVYDSKERKAHAERASGRFDDTRISNALPGMALLNAARGTVSMARMAMSLRVTVKTLMSGQTIECKDLNELLGAETAIREACENLRAYLQVAATFDGREELIEI
jgi:hypothetical protein